MVRKETWKLAGGSFFCLVLVCPPLPAWGKHVVFANKPDYERSVYKAKKSLPSAPGAVERYNGQGKQLAASLNNLAETYRKQGSYTEAEPLYQRSIAIWKKVLGPDHVAVAIGLNNLALLYTAQGTYAEAELLFKRSGAILEDELGPNSLYVAVSLENYATLLRKMDRDTEAARIKSRATAIRDKHDE